MGEKKLGRPKRSEKVDVKKASTNIPALIELSAPAPKERGKIDLEKALRYRLHNNMSYEEIGDLMGVCKQSVHKRLQPYLHDIEDIPTLKKYKSDIIHAKQLKILTELTDEKLKESTAYQLTGMFGILYDKARLEDDKSTQNVDINARVASYRQNTDEIQRLEAMLLEIEASAQPDQTPDLL